MKATICDICHKEDKTSRAVIGVTFKRGMASGAIKKIKIDLCLEHNNWHKNKKYDDVIKFFEE